MLLLLLLDCPSGYWYTTQPPANLNCNPVGLSRLTLKCITSSTEDIVNWYWTQDISDAGINGTALQDQTINYDVTMFGTNHKQLHFTVSSSTLGYYWCEISNAVNVTLRPSTITPVCLPNGSSTTCTDIQIAKQHNPYRVCVEEGQLDFPYTAPSSSVCGQVHTVYCRHISISSLISPLYYSFLFLTKLLQRIFVQSHHLSAKVRIKPGNVHSITAYLSFPGSVTPSAITSSLIPTTSYAPSSNTVS